MYNSMIAVACLKMRKYIVPVKRGNKFKYFNLLSLILVQVINLNIR